MVARPIMDAAITRAANALGLEPAAFPASRAEPWDPAVRFAEGEKNFTDVMTFRVRLLPVRAFLGSGIPIFVFARCGAGPPSERSRRWITLVGVSDSSSSHPDQNAHLRPP